MNKFERQVSPEFLEALGREDWWNKLVDKVKIDKNYNIQIRNNYINIYYKMNSLFKVSFETNAIVVLTHYKFMPVVKKQPKGKEYINIEMKDGLLNLQKNIELDCLITDLISNLKRIEKQIDMYHGDEKLYQSKLIEKNSNIILDTEAHSDYGRIDLIALINDEIVAIELKRLFDKRLHSDEIHRQLEDYNRFMKENAEDIIVAYKNTINAKISLGLIDKSSKLYNIDWGTIKISKKPILAIVADVEYNHQDVIDLYKERFFSEFEKNTCAIYMYGKDPVDLTYTYGTNSKVYC